MSFSNGVDPARVLRIDGAYLKCSDLGWQCDQTVALFQNNLDEDVHLFIIRNGVPVTKEDSQETQLCNGVQQIWLADGDLLVKDQIERCVAKTTSVKHAVRCAIWSWSRIALKRRGS